MKHSKSVYRCHETHIQVKPYDFEKEVEQGKDDLLKYLGDVLNKDTCEKKEDIAEVREENTDLVELPAEVIAPDTSEFSVCEIPKVG